MKIDLSGFNTRLDVGIRVKIRPKGLWGWFRFILGKIGYIYTKLRFKLQICFIKCLYQLLISKELDRVISKELKDDMVKRIAGLDAAIRVLRDETSD